MPLCTPFPVVVTLIFWLSCSPSASFHKFHKLPLLASFPVPRYFSYTQTSIFNHVGVYLSYFQQIERVMECSEGVQMCFRDSNGSFLRILHHQWQKHAKEPN